MSNNWNNLINLTEMNTNLQISHKDSFYTAHKYRCNQCRIKASGVTLCYAVFHADRVFVQS